MASVVHNDLYRMAVALKAGLIPPEDLATVTETLAEDGALEMVLIPSPNPGVFAGPENRGASPGQLELIDHFFTDRRQIIAAAGANNSGKTYAVGFCFCKHLRDYAQDGDVYWVMAFTEKTLNDVPCKTLWNFLPRSMFPKDRVYSPNVGFGDAKVVTLTLPNGRGRCEVWFYMEEADRHTIESQNVRGMWWTECYNEGIFDALQTRFNRDGVKSFLLMDYVPKRAWHRRRLRVQYQRGNPYIYWQHFTTIQNLHNSAEGDELARLAETLSESEYRMRVLGEEMDLEGLVYPMFTRSRHTCPGFVIPRDWPRYRMLDFGGGASPTACGFFAVSPVGFNRWPTEKIVAYREYYATHSGRVSATQHANAIKVLSEGERFVGGGVYCDPAGKQIGVGNTMMPIEQYAKAGLSCTKWPRTNAYGTDAMVERVRKALEDDRFVVMDHCVNMIAEFESWGYKKKREGAVDEYVDRYEDGNDHLLDGVKALLAMNPCYDRQRYGAQQTMTLMGPGSRSKKNGGAKKVLDRHPAGV